MKRFLLLLLVALCAINLSAQTCSYGASCSATTSTQFVQQLTAGCDNISIGNNTIDLTGETLDLSGIQITYSGSASVTLDGATIVDECTTFTGTSGATEITIDIAGTGFVFTKTSTPSIADLNASIANGAGTLGEAAIALPVRLVSFAGAAKKNEILLEWVSAEEDGNDFYTIEKSTDGRFFTPAGRVEGEGFSTGYISYQWEDKAPASGTNHYRLVQTDLDGTTAHLGVVSLNWFNGNWSASPNPVATNGTLKLSGVDAVGPQTTVQLVNANGSVVASLPYSEQVSLPTDLAPGVYLLRVPGKQLHPLRIVVR